MSALGRKRTSPLFLVNQTYGDFPLATGQVMALRLHGEELTVEGMEGLAVPATHTAQNIGDTPYKEFMVELKRPSSGEV